jgi:succinate dehydrogenase/fumarate reductase flavoprotein subunit
MMSEPKLQEALERVMGLKREKEGTMTASGMRELIKARETQTMVLSAEMTLRASMMRKETRENLFYRQDYPNPDNAKWLKWIVVQKGSNGDMKFSTEDIPFDRYKFRPGSKDRLQFING